VVVEIDQPTPLAVLLALNRFRDIPIVTLRLQSTVAQLPRDDYRTCAVNTTAIKKVSATQIVKIMRGPNQGCLQPRQEDSIPRVHPRIVTPHGLRVTQCNRKSLPIRVDPFRSQGLGSLETLAGVFRGRCRPRQPSRACLSKRPVQIIA